MYSPTNPTNPTSPPNTPNTPMEDIDVLHGINDAIERVVRHKITTDNPAWEKAHVHLIHAYNKIITRWWREASEDTITNVEVTNQ